MKAQPQGSELERAFLFFVKAEKLPIPESEFRFTAGAGRRWRFDFAYPEYQIAIECEGGHFTGGRHVRGQGFENDCIKYSEAAIHGWLVLRVTARMIEDGTATSLVRRALASRRGQSVV